MKAFSNYFFIAILCASGFFLQSCWKDKSIKDKDFGDIHLDMSPTYGIPLVNLKIKGEDVVTRINRDSSSNSFYIEYDRRDYDLCVIVYDKVNIPMVVPPTLNVFDTTLKFPLNFFKDLRMDGWSPMRAYFMLYVDNNYTTNFDSRLVQLDYEDKNGVINPVFASGVTLPINGNTVTAGGRTLAFDTLRINRQEADDIIFNGKETTVGFGVTASTPPGSGGDLNLNPWIKVPAHLTAPGIVRWDSTELDFGKVVDYVVDGKTVTAESVTLYLKMVNALPLDARVQVYFANANYTILDSIYHEDIFVDPGLTSTNYLVHTPVVTEKAISMTKEKLMKLKTTKHLIIRELYTSKDKNGTVHDVKLFKSNFMDVILSIKVDAKVDGTIKEIEDEFNNK